MSEQTIRALRAAINNPAIVARYQSHIRRSDVNGECWLWTGAISGKGHGRFSIGDDYSTAVGVRRRTTIVVIAHRFGYALHHGVDALLEVPLIAHRCDVTLCQNPAHWEDSNHRANTRDSHRRRDVVRGPLADTRGARGRAYAIRAAARSGTDVAGAIRDGLRPVHRDQLLLPTLESGSAADFEPPAPSG